MFKRIPKGVWLILIGLAAVTALASQALAATAPGAAVAPSKLMSQKTLNANAWLIYTTNYGPFVKPQTGSGGFWRNPAHGYIYGAGMWVGAADESGNKIVAVGYNPNNGASEFGPVDMSNAYEGYLSDAGVRVYLSNNPLDYAAWPVLEGGRKVVKSRQDSYARYSDANPQFTTSGDKRLNVVIEQFSYAWNYADNNDIVFFYFKVHNKSGKTLSNVYIGPGNDCDIGNEAQGSANDRTTFDYNRNLAIQFQTVNEPQWDKTGAVGFRYFESPINNTGNVVNVADNQYPHKIWPWGAWNDSIRARVQTLFPDSVHLWNDSTAVVNRYGKKLYSLGMTAFKIFTIDQDPKTDEERYLEMMGINYWDLIPDAYDEWGADVAADKRFLMSSGPFILGNDSIATTCIGVIGALDTIKLKLASDIAQTIYDNNFELATPPAAPALTITPGDKQVIISWDRRAETTPDPYWEKLDATRKWFTYFAGSWKGLPPAGKALVDSFEIKTGAFTTVKIEKGNANPVGGTDTVNARYSDQAMYNEYDFQGYIAYRARTVGDLADPEKREYIGTLYIDPITDANPHPDTNTTFNPTTLSYGGGQGYFYDKVDGIKIMNNFDAITYYTPGGEVSLAKYDTLGTDRGLIYSIVDNNVINGFGWYYGVSAYDYQTNVFFTHKCPISLISNPTENAAYGVAQKPMVDYQAPTIKYSVTGPSDAKTGGTVNYSNKLLPVPKDVNNDTFRLIWKPVTKVIEGSNRIPVYSAELRDWRYVKLYDSTGAAIKDTLIDTALHKVSFKPSYNYVGSDPFPSFFGTLNDEMPFGGVIFMPAYRFKPWLAVVETVEVTGRYPKDSLWAQVVGNANYAISSGFWQWRGSDFEIRWRDTVVATRNCLTATVWDITNNVLVPLETGVTKPNMTLSSWCFNPTANTCISFVDSAQVSSYGMYVCGITLYFNRRDGGSQKRMVWSQRPQPGDVWTVRSPGPGNPMGGGVVTFITTKASQKADLSASLLDKIKVVPNPYLVRANWDVSKNYPNIYFTNLPSKCTIRIYNLAGDLIRVLNHESSFDDNNGTAKWDLLSTYDKRPASGVYIFQIDAPGIGTKLGKFAVIK